MVANASLSRNSSVNTARELYGRGATPCCGGDLRVFAELTKLPQVPAKDAWPCATKKVKLASLDRPTRDRIVKRLEELESDPYDSRLGKPLVCGSIEIT